MNSVHDYHHFRELYGLDYIPEQPVSIAALVRRQYALESNQKERALLSGGDRCRCRPRARILTSWASGTRG
ncbi:hypothetical protein ACRALDRAFT_2059977 [Sodiomyces alcalophilus JCM 7366]|uniref:uncharacterized protein n=1 Tax=Sodiomyces alcalophilus JCM 7366 TaxID=591952 RepID=UPI0039B45D03